MRCLQDVVALEPSARVLAHVNHSQVSELIVDVPELDFDAVLARLCAKNDRNHFVPNTRIISLIANQVVRVVSDRKTTSKVRFEKKVTDLKIEKEKVTGVHTSDGDFFKGDAVILATGHSARDIFELLNQKKIAIEAKPFALGVRVEHPQILIDQLQYHCTSRGEFLPPAAYSLVQQVNGRGVFSFCMCPGGIIAPAATSPGELVVNGWSPSKRNNPYANSGMVVNVAIADAANSRKKNNLLSKESSDNPLQLMWFQQMVEQQCYNAGGGDFKAPAQRMVDFSNGKLSNSLPDCSYQPGIDSVQLSEVLPDFIYHSLAQGFKAFGKKMKGYFSNEAVVVATESRTSSPIRIPRDSITLTHPQLTNFYPCGEGAGYAGGIVSAAMDGERIAKQIEKTISKL